MNVPPPVTGYRKWIALVLVTTGTFMVLLDTTIVDIALPKMMSTFEVDLYDIQWVIISYLLGSIIFMCCVGWLGNRYGSKYVFLSGLTIFTVLSIACGVAPNIDFMNVSRFLQGLGEGLVLPTGLVIIFESFPKSERGLATGFYGLGAALAPAIGPCLGGFITEHFSWRWIFYVNIPIGLAAVIVGWYFLTRGMRAEKRQPFDLIGFVLITIAFSALILFITKGQEKGWLQSDYILTLVIIFALSFPLFVAWLMYTRKPLLDLSLFRDRTYALCIAAFCLVTFALYGFWVLIPVYLERLRGFSTFTAGLIMFPGSIAGALSVLAAGIIVDRWRPRAVFYITLIGAVVASFIFNTDLFVSKRHIAWDYSLWMIFIVATFAPMNVVTFVNLKTEQLNMGSTILYVGRLLFGSIGTSYSISLLSKKMGEYYTVLSARAHYGEPAARAFIGDVIFRRGGTVDSGTINTIKAMIREYITAYSASYAFEAVFKTLTLWFGAALVFALFIKKPKKIELEMQLH
jgi:DHA2 family multidrug resistance protein